jgi:uncharacterized protein YrrD
MYIENKQKLNMERLFRQNIGNPVIAEDIKGPIGVLRDFVVDTENGKIVAIVLNKKKNLVVGERDIVSFTVFPRINSKEALIEGEDLVRVNNIQKKGIYIIDAKVFTEKGKYLGDCYDYSFDDNSLKLKKIFIAKNFLFFFSIDERIIPIEEIIEIKRDKIIVKDDFVAEKQGSLAGVS